MTTSPADRAVQRELAKFEIAVLAKTHTEEWLQDAKKQAVAISRVGIEANQDAWQAFLFRKGRDGLIINECLVDRPRTYTNIRVGPYGASFLGGVDVV